MAERKKETRQVELCVPIIQPEAVSYCERKPELSLEPAEARTLAGVVRALSEQGMRLADGRQVRDGASALRWILQQAGK